MLYFLAFLVLTAGFRLWELRVSKRNLATHTRARAFREPGFIWMVGLHVAFFVIQPLELFWRRPPFGGVISWLAIAVTFCALLLRFWTLRSLGRSWNVRVVHGRNYPIKDQGPYRYIRHPNYLVVFLEIAFIPLIYQLYWSALILTLWNLAVLRARINLEEATLRQNPEWVVRMAHKPRFFPWPRKRRP